MTVKELMAILEKLPADAYVTYVDFEEQIFPYPVMGVQYIENGNTIRLVG